MNLLRHILKDQKKRTKWLIVCAVILTLAGLFTWSLYVESTLTVGLMILLLVLLLGFWFWRDYSGRPMGLLTKTTLTLGIYLLSLGTFLYLGAATIIRIGFEKWEVQEALEDVELARTLLAHQPGDLELLATDWACWDDIDAFVQDHKPEFVQKNLKRETLETLHLQLLAIVDLESNIVWAGTFDSMNTYTYLTGEDFTHQYGQLLLQHFLPPTKESRSGIVLHGEHPIIVASAPILKRQKEDKVRGLVIMARAVDMDAVNRIGFSLNVDMTLLAPEEFEKETSRASRRNLSSDKHTVVNLIDRATLVAYGRLMDPKGHPSLAIKITKSRAIHRQEVWVTNVFGIFFAVVGVIFILGGTLALTQKVVLNRLVRLSGKIHLIAGNEQFDDVVPVEGSDELAQVALDINQLLEAVRNSQRKLADLSATLYAIGDGVMAFNKEGTVLSLNAAAESLTGWLSTEIVGRFFEDFICLVNPKTHEVLGQEVQRTIEKGMALELPNPTILVGKGGKERYIAGSLAPIRDAKGSVTGAVLVFRDITEEWSRGERLRESEAFQRQLLKSLPVGVMIVDSKARRIEQVNEHAAALFGGPPGLLLGHRCHQWICPAEEEQCPICDLGNSIDHSERVLLRADGTTLPILKTVRKINVAGQEKLLECFVDISDQKRLEESIYHLSEFQKLLIRITLRFINVSHSEVEQAVQEALAEMGEFVQADRCSIFEYDWNKNICVNTYEWCAPGIPSQKAQLQAIPLEISPWWVEKHKKGEVIAICDVKELDGNHDLKHFLKAHNIKSVIALPILQGSLCIGFVGFDAVRENRVFSSAEIQLLKLFAELLKNVKLRQEMLEELIQTRQRAEAANKAKSIFLSTMSHEMRTPMNAVLGYAQILERDPALQPRHKEQVQAVIRSGQHLLDLINEILEITKLETGRIELQTTVFSLVGFLSDLELMFRSLTEAKKLHFQVIVDDKVPAAIIADKGKLRQILLHLMSNAVRFTEKGRITLRVWPEPEDLWISGDVKKVRLFFEVEDTGSGIAECDMHRIFEIFGQGEAGLRSGGIGTGLAVSRGYVEMMGGELTVHSVVGQGSTFRFHIVCQPVEDLPEGTERPEKQRPRMLGLASPGPWRILVVDDMAVNRKLLIELLKPLGFEVREAENGQEALDIFNLWNPHAILMDMEMPVMDGYEATRRAKSSEAGRSTHIIAITAHSDDETKAQILTVGASAVIQKPVQIQELYDTLGWCLGLQYEYADELPRMMLQPCSKPLRSEDLAELPQPLVKEMYKAVTEGDISQLLALIGEVDALDKALALQLKMLAEAYDYGTLEKLLTGGAQEHEGDVDSCNHHGGG